MEICHTFNIYLSTIISCVCVCVRASECERIARRKMPLQSEAMNKYAWTDWFPTIFNAIKIFARFLEIQYTILTHTHTHLYLYIIDKIWKHMHTKIHSSTHTHVRSRASYERVICMEEIHLLYIVLFSGINFHLIKFNLAHRHIFNEFIIPLFDTHIDTHA